jgi:hypothetical protein
MHSTSPSIQSTPTTAPIRSARTADAGGAMGARPRAFVANREPQERARLILARWAWLR